MPALPRARPPHAVVVGASLTGLVAAETLGRHVERVTLVERDDLPQALVSLRGVAGGHHHLRALRRVLAAPRVVVRSGLEASGLEVESGRVRGVEVRPRSVDARGPALTLHADLVVDASGRATAAPPVPDGLLVIEPTDDPGTAAMIAVVLNRCLTEHLSRGTDLTGLSAAATSRVARANAHAPGRPADAATDAVEAC